MPMTFAEAVALWSDLRNSEDETTFEAFEVAELAILNHEPISQAEAIQIEQVIDFNLETGPRFDGLDVDAAARVAVWRATALPQLVKT